MALVLWAGLAFAMGAQAKPRHQPLKCRAGHTRRTVSIPRRLHGRIVRRHGRIVYIKVQRCVTTPKPKPSSPVAPPAGTPTAPTTSQPPVTPTAPTPPPTPSPTPVPPPLNTVAPGITGSAVDGSILSASRGTWTNSPTSYGYQWQRCNLGGCQQVVGQTNATYLVSGTDIGSSILVEVSASNGSGSASAVSAVTGTVRSSGDPVAVAVGDIACAPGDTAHACRQSATEALAEKQHPGEVFVLGDNQYMSGLFSEYTGAGGYGPTWGQAFKSIVHPVPGNHEYAMSSTAAGYFQYFGPVANPDGTPGGYYSFNPPGSGWHIVALNSDCSSSGCTDSVAGTTSSAQVSWLQADLAANKTACVLAMWHHPYFSGGDVGNSPGVAPLWNALYSAHADIVLGGHDHIYERYPQLDPSGNPSSTGIREFVVGTGGENLGNYVPGNVTTPPGPPAFKDASDFGVLVLTLHPNSYDWKFVTTSGQTADSGTSACHGAGASAARFTGTRTASRAAPAELSAPQLSFTARPRAALLSTAERRGLTVAVHCSRACDVLGRAWLLRGHRLTPLGSFYLTESQTEHPNSQTLLHLPARSLAGLAAATLVTRFTATDAAGHRHNVTRIVRLG
jgi:hypothetical protein